MKWVSKNEICIYPLVIGAPFHTSHCTELRQHGSHIVPAYFFVLFKENQSFRVQEVELLWRLPRLRKEGSLRIQAGQVCQVLLEEFSRIQKFVYFKEGNHSRISDLGLAKFVVFVLLSDGLKNVIYMPKFCDYCYSTNLF